MTVSSEWSNQPVLSPLVIITSGAPTTGFFVYSGTPGKGNPPVFSVVAPGVTTDPYGNAVQDVVQAGGSGSFTRIESNGTIVLYGTGANPDIIIDPIRSAMFFYSPTAGAGNLAASISPTSGNDVFGNSFSPGVVSYGGASGYAQMLNGTIFFAIPGAAVLNTPLVAVNPDTTSFDIYSGNTTGNVRSRIKVAQGNNITTSALNAWSPSSSSPITPETWHPMTLLNSWTNRGTGFTNAQYRLLASPPNSVEVIGEISHASITGNSQIWTAPAGYVPANSQALMGGDPVSGGQLFINNTGALTVFGLSSTTVVQFHGVYSLDA